MLVISTVYTNLLKLFIIINTCNTVSQLAVSQKWLRRMHIHLLAISVIHSHLNHI